MKKTFIFISVVLLYAMNMMAQNSQNKANSTQQELQVLRQEIEQLKERVQELEQALPQPKPKEIKLPCADAATDTETHYFELAVGEGITQREAIQNANQNANEYLAARLYGHPSSVQKNVIIHNAETWCREVRTTSVGTYEAFVTIRVAKSAIK